MWYKFIEGEPKGRLRVKQVQVCWYDTENCNGDCFDESFVYNNGDEENLLNTLGLWTTYVDMNEDVDKNKSDRSRVFVHMDDGSVYELLMRKLIGEDYE